VRTAHQGEDMWIYVLKGYIEVWEDFSAIGNRFDELLTDACGVEIKQANPVEHWDFGELGEEGGQG